MARACKDIELVSATRCDRTHTTFVLSLKRSCVISFGTFTGHNRARIVNIFIIIIYIMSMIVFKISDIHLWQ